MKINIKKIDLELRYSNRMYILYENIMGKSLNFENVSSYTSLIVLLYSAIVATIQRNKLDLTLTYDEFMDWLDEQNSKKLLEDFSQWFAEQIMANNDLKDITIEDVEKAKSETKKSKN